MKGRYIMSETHLNVNTSSQSIQTVNTTAVEAKSNQATTVNGNPASKLDSREKAHNAQTSSPLTKLDASKFVKIACGFALIGLGSVAMAALSPIALPLALLGGAASFTGAKVAQEMEGQLKNEATTRTLSEAIVLGASMGSLGCLALVYAGAQIIKGATKNEAPTGAKAEVAKQPPPKELNEAEKGFQTEVNTLLIKLNNKANLRDEHNNIKYDANGKMLEFNETMFKEEAVDIKNRLTESIKNNEISKEVGDKLLFKLSYNPIECMMQCKIDRARDALKNGNTKNEEIKDKSKKLKEELSANYKDNLINEDFYKSSLKEIKEFKGDFKIGQKALQEKNQMELGVALNKSANLLGSQAKFANFTEEILKQLPNSNLNGKDLFNKIRQDLIDIKNITSDKNLTPEIKRNKIVAKGGSNRIMDLEAMVKTLENTILEANGIGKKTEGESTEITEKRNEIKSSIEILKKELDTEASVFPTEKEVKDAYDTLRKYAKGTGISEDAPIAVTNEPKVSNPDIDQDANLAELERILGEEIEKNLGGAAPNATKEAAVPNEVNRLMTEADEGIDDEAFAKLAEFAELETAPKTETTPLKNDPAAALFDDIDKMTGAKLDEVFDNLPKVEPETAPKAEPTPLKNDPAKGLFDDIDKMTGAKLDEVFDNLPKVESESAPKAEPTPLKNDPAKDLFAEMEALVNAARKQTPGNNIKI